MSELSRGVSDFGRGLRFLLAHPRLWGWVIAPAVVTLLLMIALVLAATFLLDGLTARLVAWLPGWLQSIAGTGLTALLGVALALVAALLFVSVAGAIAGPFCELLSDAVEAQVTGRPAAPFSLASFLKELTIGLGHTVRRLLVALTSAGFLFLLSLLPLAGALLGLALAGLFAARSAAYDCYDAILARRVLPYRAKLAFLARYRARTFALGAVVASLLLVPGVNLVVLGVGATGATLAALDLGA